MTTMTPAAESLQQNSILLVVRLSKPGNRRKAPSGLVTVDADREAITVSKELLDCPELAAIATLDGKVRNWVYARSLPSGILREGVYRLPLALVDEVDRGLEEFQGWRKDAIEAFLAVYPQKVQEARGRLRALYDARDYPPEEALREAFDLQWRYLAVDVPQSLNAALMRREREKAAQDVRAEVDEIRLALRMSFAELVQHAADRLAPGQDGKPRVFRDSLVKNMEEFLQYFSARNLTQDGELASLVERARGVLHGVTPDDLRAHDGLRRDIQKTMAGIKAAMDEGTMLKPSRRFFLEPAGAVA